MKYLPNKLYLNFFSVTTIVQFVGKSCKSLHHFHVYIAVVCNVQLKLSPKPSSARFAMLMFPKSSYLTLTSMFSFRILWLVTETFVTWIPLAFQNEHFNCFLLTLDCVSFYIFTKYFIQITICRSKMILKNFRDHWFFEKKIASTSWANAAQRLDFLSRLKV